MFLRPITFFNGAVPVSAFISDWKTDNSGTSNDDQITIPTEAGGSYNCNVAWGDGTDDDITTYDDLAWTHTYAGGAGTYTVTITGQCEGIRFNNGGDKSKLILISMWGPDLRIINPGSFRGCNNLVITADDPDTAFISTSWNNMFQLCAALTTIPNIGNVDFSSVLSLNACFNGATNFNEPSIDDWDTSSLTNLGTCFMNTSFDNPLSNWDISSVTHLGSTFRGTSFNQDISGWDTGLVANWSGTFRSNSDFDQDISGLDVTAGNNFALFLNGGGLSTANYDALLDINTGWPSQVLNIDVTADFGSSGYTLGGDAETGHDKLTDAVGEPDNGYSWDVTDGGGV